MSALEDVAKQLQAETSEEVSRLSADSTPSRFRFKAWFEDLPLAGKIRTVFGTFLGVVIAMTLVLGLGLSELYNRYMAHADLMGAVQSSAELRSTTGEFRYNAVRYIFGAEEAALERQRSSYTHAREQLESIGEVVDRRVPQFGERVDQLSASMAAYDAKFEELRE